MLLKELLENINAMPLPKDLEKKTKEIKNSWGLDDFLDDMDSKYYTLGAGSSREVFSIPDPRATAGRPLATKVASDWRRGPAQNKAETKREKALRKYMDIKKRKDIRILIPLVDYDKSSSSIWVQQREAKKFDYDKFQKFVGIDFEDYGDIINSLMNEFGIYFQKNGKKVQLKYIKAYLRNSKKITKNSMTEKFLIQCVKLARELKINFEDLTTENNWGTYKDKPVIVDYGFNEEVHRRFY